MGIKGLKQFIKSKFPQCLVPFHLYHCWGKKVAMDLLPYLYRYKASHGDRWQEGLFTLLTVCIRNNVHLSVIMDGPDVYKEKDKEREKRKMGRDRIKSKIEQLEADLVSYDTNGTISERIQEMVAVQHPLSIKKTEKINRTVVVDEIQRLRNQMVSITEEDISSVKEMCRQLSLPFFMALQEAESFSSFLCKKCQVEIVMTEDTDVLAYGCPQWISNVAHDGSCISITYSHLLEQMKMDRLQFIDFCILCGTDYNETIPGVGPVSSYKLIDVHKTIEKALEGKSDEQIHGLKYVLLRTIFESPCPFAIPRRDMIQPFSITISYNSLPEEASISYPYATSFLTWIRSYPNKFLFE